MQQIPPTVSERKTNKNYITLEVIRKGINKNTNIFHFYFITKLHNKRNNFFLNNLAYENQYKKIVVFLERR